jgi:hypothetical protein
MDVIYYYDKTARIFCSRTTDYFWLILPLCYGTSFCEIFHASTVPCDAAYRATTQRNAVLLTMQSGEDCFGAMEDADYERINGNDANLF